MAGVGICGDPFKLISLKPKSSTNMKIMMGGRGVVAAVVVNARAATSAPKDKKQ